MDEHFKQILFNYFSGRYSEAEEAALLEWLEESEENRKLFSEMADWWATAHVPVFMSDMKDDFETHFGELIREEPVAKQGKTYPFFLRIAASLLILVSIGISSYWLGKKSGRPEMLVRTYEAYVPYGSQSQVVLPDESVVWINAGTTVIYRENPITNTREITLDGEAYFEIATDSLRPMVINSESIQVQVMGTSFNIKAYQEEDRIDITLVTGKINVFLDELVPESKIELMPNNMLSYNKTNSEFVIEYVNPKDMLAWKNGVFKFRNQSFEQIARILERKYDVQIKVESNVLKKEFFTGSFSARYPVEHILEEVDIDKKYKWFRKGTEIIIRDK